MYTDGEQKVGLPIKIFILCFVLVIIFLFVLMWFLPISNRYSKYHYDSSNENTKLNVLADRIFNSNVQEMKSAGLNYFKSDKLPKKNNQTSILTLKQMIDKKLIIPFTDKNGRSCDDEKSYVSVKKKNNEYEMKVNLKCEKEEDYILLKLDCISCNCSDNWIIKDCFIYESSGSLLSCAVLKDKNNNIKYEYEKKYDNKYSDWSSWKVLTYEKNDLPSFGKYELIEIENLGRQNIIDYYEYSNGEPFYQYKNVQIGSAIKSYCDGYNYYRNINDSNTTYAVREKAQWRYVGKVSSNEILFDTVSVKYEFVGFDTTCVECKKIPKKIWKKYTREVSVMLSPATMVSEDGYVTRCSKIGAKNIEIFDTAKSFVGYELVRIPFCKEIYSYRQRTRKLIKEEYTDYKWSVFNNETLLKKGYTYTGNKKIAA